MLRTRLNRLYRAKRGLSEGIDDNVPFAYIFNVLVSKALQRTRAISRGIPNGYVGRGVKIVGRSHLSLGTDVVIGDGVALHAFSAKGIVLGDRVTVDTHSILRATAVIRNYGTGIAVGSRTAIGAYNVILGQGGVTIGSDCLLGPNVTLLSENHVFDSSRMPIREQGEVRAGLCIRDNVWIGAGATIMSGVTIGAGAIVAAGAVVTKDVEEFTIVGGVPAVVLRTRDRSV